MEAVNMPELDCWEFNTWSVTPPLAATGPVDALVLDADTPEVSAPVLLWPLLRVPVGVLLSLLACSTPVKPACDKPLLAVLAPVSDEVLPLLDKVGDDVAALSPLLPVLPVVSAETEQFTWRSM
jgi:hypothetical protein